MIVDMEPKNERLRELRMRDYNMIRASNSTGSLFTVDSTIIHPDNPKLISCVSEYFRSNIQPSPSNPLHCTNSDYDIFDETIYPIATTPKNRLSVRRLPDPYTVEDFATLVFNTGNMSTEALILSVGYLGKVLEKTAFRLYPQNWKRALMSIFILSSKCWEDLSVWNGDFKLLANVVDMNKLEMTLLGMLQYEVTMKSSEYVSIYFNLRAQSNASGESFAELKPLDKEGSARLELMTSGFLERVKQRLSRSEEVSTRFL